MWKNQLRLWQIGLVERLERNLGRPLKPDELGDLLWNPLAQTLTVEGSLLRELRRESVMPNVFRSSCRPPPVRVSPRRIDVSNGR